MASDSPSLNWMPFFDGTSMSSDPSASDLLWSKSHGEQRCYADGDVYSHRSDPASTLLDSNGLSGLHTFDAHDVLADHGTSSGASTYSDSDSFPASTLHHLPAWSTVGKMDEPQKQDDSTSPGDAISPSGLSDRNGDNGLMDDLWFIPSPETGAPPGAHGALQRKKRMQFAKQLPSSLQRTEQRPGHLRDGSPGASLSLKAHKSVPNLSRRVSSGYTARLEELLAEMGWPKNYEGNGEANGGNVAEAQDADVGDDTIQGTYHGETTSYASTGDDGQASGSRQADTSGTVIGSLAGGMPNHSTSSALYQRRAESRDGNMPTPVPVAVPKRPDDPFSVLSATSSATTESAIYSIEEQHAQRQHNRSGTANDALDPIAAAAQHSIDHERAAAMAAQHQRLQQLSSMVDASSTSGVHKESNANDTSKSAHSTLGESPIDSNSHMLFASSVPPIGTSPATGRPNTASSGSNTTELRTPITPFVGMSLNSAPATQTPSWTASQAFAFAPQTGNGNATSDPRLMQFGKMPNATMDKDAQTERYLASLQNSLGLYNVANPQASTAAVNPAAVLDPSAFSSVFGNLTGTPATGHDFASQPAGNSQRLIFPPQQQKVVPVGQSLLGQRPRAGTAMAALGGPAHPSPRHMRSTPNLHLSPSPSLDGSQYNPYGGSASVTNTPIKTVRKIASNRRLSMLTATPDTPSMQGFAPGTLPNSPISPTKRGRSGGMLSTSTSVGNLGGAFEFINYGIEDADELCAAVAPSGSYKVPLKGFGEGGDEEDEGGDGAEDDDDEGDGASGGTDNEGAPRSPRRSGALRRPRSSTNRSGPRWADPDAPPVPSLSGNPDSNAAASALDGTNAGRQIKRRKSDASMMLAGRRKSPSMSNLRKRE